MVSLSGGTTSKGSGCANNSATAKFDAATDALLIDFVATPAHIGPMTPESEKSKTCEIVLTLKAPAHWSWAILQTELSGHAKLDANVKGTVVAAFNFKDEPTHNNTTGTLPGPRDDNYMGGLLFPANQQLFSPCGAPRPLKIDITNSISTTMPGATGTLGGQTAGNVFHQRYFLTWKMCPPDTMPMGR
jgi:hypothetical protein